MSVPCVDLPPCIRLPTCLVTAVSGNACLCLLCWQSSGHSAPWNHQFLVVSGEGKDDFSRLLNFLSCSLCVVLPCRIKNAYRPSCLFFFLSSLHYVACSSPSLFLLANREGDESRERSSVQIKCYTLRPDINAHLFVLSENRRERRFLILVSLPAESTEINQSLLFIQGTPMAACAY